MVDNRIGLLATDNLNGFTGTIIEIGSGPNEETLYLIEDKIGNTHWVPEAGATIKEVSPTGQIEMFPAETYVRKQ